MKVIIVGRDSTNDIVVNDVRVSRNHMQLVYDDQGVYWVIDLGSSNGTYVNGKRITKETRLDESDKIMIGSTEINWLSYFSICHSNTMPSESHSAQRKHNRWFLYAGFSLFLLIIILLVSWLVFNQTNDNNSSNIVSQDSMNSDKYLVEEYSKVIDVQRTKRDSVENENLKLQNSNKATNKKLSKTENELNKTRRQLEEEMEVIEKNKLKLAQQQNEINNQKVLNKSLKSQISQAQNETAKATADLKRLEEEFKLVEEFTLLLPDIAERKGAGVDICKKLKYQVINKAYIKCLSDNFSTSDVAGKKKILDAVRSVLNKDKTEKAKDSILVK